MGRPAKQGRQKRARLNYFTIPTTFFNDLRTRKLLHHADREHPGAGPAAVVVYMALRCLVHNNEAAAYRLDWDEDLPFIIYEMTGIDEDLIEEVIEMLARFGFISAPDFEKDRSITSEDCRAAYEALNGPISEESSKLKVLLEDSINTSEVSADGSEVKDADNQSFSNLQILAPVNDELMDVNDEKTEPIIVIEKENKIKEKKERERESCACAHEGTRPLSEKKSKILEPPETMAEVEALCREPYFAELGATKADARKFYSYYTARGWLLKDGQPMMNWRAGFGAWMQRETGRKPQQVRKPAPVAESAPAPQPQSDPPKVVDPDELARQIEYMNAEVEFIKERREAATRLGLPFDYEAMRREFQKLQQEKAGQEAAAG